MGASSVAGSARAVCVDAAGLLPKGTRAEGATLSCLTKEGRQQDAVFQHGMTKNAVLSVWVRRMTIPSTVGGDYGKDSTGMQRQREHLADRFTSDHPAPFS
jgi:hypothetical protein